MKKLDVLFGDTQAVQIEDLALVSVCNKSEVARAALQLGLMQIKELMSRNTESANDVIMINSVRGKQ